jgi:hypothetical protein
MTASQKGTAGMDAITWKIFEDFGLKGKKKLSFDDFFALVTDETQDLSKVGLDFKGNLREPFIIILRRFC